MLHLNQQPCTKRHRCFSPVAGTLAERGQEEVYKRAGLLSQAEEVPQACGDAGAAAGSSDEVTCGVCMCEGPRQEATTMECGHTFCNTCWREHLRWVASALVGGGFSAAGLAMGCESYCKVNCELPCWALVGRLPAKLLTLKSSPTPDSRTVLRHDVTVLLCTLLSPACSISISEGLSRRLKCMAAGCGVVCEEPKVSRKVESMRHVPCMCECVPPLLKLVVAGAPAKLVSCQFAPLDSLSH